MQPDARQTLVPERYAPNERFVADLGAMVLDLLQQEPRNEDHQRFSRHGAPELEAPHSCGNR